MPDIQRAIETCLDAEALRAHLQPLFSAQGAIDAVRITKARRSASRHRAPNPLTFCCEVDLTDGTTLRCHGKVFRAGPGALAAQGTRALHVPDLDLLLWPWPQDPGLPQLPTLLDPRATLPHWGMPAATVEAVRYEPEDRVTLRYTRGDGCALYAKTYSDDRAQAVARRFAWMWALSQAHPRAPRVARPLNDGSVDHTLWQEAAAGTPLAQLLHDVQRTDWITPLAQAIALIHAAPTELAASTPRTTRHWLEEVQRRRKKIGRALPELTERADATAQAIERAAQHLPDKPLTLIHADFHPEQVWFDGERVVLFDFDEFTLGDPMEDLAAFVVKLPVGHPSAALWLGACAQAAPRHFCRPRLAWHIAVQQLVQASRAFVFQLADWRGEVQHRLDRAQELAQQLDGASMP